MHILQRTNTKCVRRACFFKECRNIVASFLVSRGAASNTKQHSKDIAHLQMYSLQSTRYHIGCFEPIGLGLNLTYRERKRGGESAVILGSLRLMTWNVVSLLHISKIGVPVFSSTFFFYFILFFIYD